MADLDNSSECTNAMIKAFEDVMLERDAHPNAIYEAVKALTVAMMIGLKEKFDIDKFRKDCIKQYGSIKK